MGILQEEHVEDTPLTAISKFKRMNTAIYNTLNIMHKVAFDFVWCNRIWTPKQMVEAMGTDAVLIFTVSSKIQEVLYASNPEYVPLTPTCPVIFCEDGSATVEM